MNDINKPGSVIMNDINKLSELVLLSSKDTGKEPSEIIELWSQYGLLNPGQALVLLIRFTVNTGWMSEIEGGINK